MVSDDDDMALKDGSYKKECLRKVGFVYLGIMCHNKSSVFKTRSKEFLLETF